MDSRLLILRGNPAIRFEKMITDTLNLCAEIDSRGTKLLSDFCTVYENCYRIIISAINSRKGVLGERP